MSVTSTIQRSLVTRTFGVPQITSALMPKGAQTVAHGASARIALADDRTSILKALAKAQVEPTIKGNRSTYLWADRGVTLKIAVTKNTMQITILSSTVINSDVPSETVESADVPTVVASESAPAKPAKAPKARKSAKPAKADKPAKAQPVELPFASIVAAWSEFHARSMFNAVKLGDAGVYSAQATRRNNSMRTALKFLQAQGFKIDGNIGTSATVTAAATIDGYSFMVVCTMRGASADANPGGFVATVFAAK